MGFVLLRSEVIARTAWCVSVCVCDRCQANRTEEMGYRFCVFKLNGMFGSPESEGRMEERC